jgi:hypothetical protein
LLDLGFDEGVELFAELGEPFALGAEAVEVGLVALEENEQCVEVVEDAFLLEVGLAELALPEQQRGVFELLAELAAASLFERGLESAGLVGLDGVEQADELDHLVFEALKAVADLGLALGQRGLLGTGYDGRHPDEQDAEQQAADEIRPAGISCLAGTPHG